MNMNQTKNELVFVVDDDQISLLLTKQLLSTAGYTNIRLFPSTASFLNSLTEKPEIIFLDYNIDHLNGIDLLKKVMRFDPNILVILISGQDCINVAVTSLKYGAFDYITKTDLNTGRIHQLVQKIDKARILIEKRQRKGILQRILTSIKK